MSYQDSLNKKIKKLLYNPKENFKKVIPFLKFIISPYIRRYYEFFGNYSLSKPYQGHSDLLKQLGNIKNGFFVECGGNDGYGFDPTYYLEKALGWEGIIAEPLPIYKLCKKNRSRSVVYNCATGPFNSKEKTVSFVDCNLMSFVEGSIDNEKEWIDAGEKAQSIKSQIVIVPIRPAQELIEDYFKTHKIRKIDLFVADTEGYEFAIIQGLDFTKNSPVYILLEIHKNSELDLIQKYLEDKNYELLREIGEKDFLFKLK